MRVTGPAHLLFAAGLIGLGILGLIQGDFALVWQPVPTWVPAREALAYVSGAVLILTGAGLLFDASVTRATRALVVYLLLWLLLLKVPGVIAAPLVEGSWLACGEITVVVAGGWILFAMLPTRPGPSMLAFATGDNGVRLARCIFGFALPAIGLSHFFYIEQTAALVPAWLPFRTGWAYLAGAGQIAAGLGVLIGISPRLAATAEAAMLGIFTLLVWVPGIAAAPTDRLQWTAFTMSWTIAAGAALVAWSYRDMPWISLRPTPLRRPPLI